MAGQTILTKVIYPQVVSKIDGLSKESEMPNNRITGGISMIENLNEEWMKRAVLMYGIVPSSGDQRTGDFECMFYLYFDSKDHGVTLNRMFIKKNQDETPFEFEQLSNKMNRVKISDLWDHVVDGTLTLITEWKVLVYKPDIRQDISLQNLILQHLMLNLSKKNVLEVLEIAKLGGFKLLMDQCISLTQIHIDELKGTPKFATLKTELKDEIFHRPKLIWLTNQQAASRRDEN